MFKKENLPATFSLIFVSILAIIFIVIYLIGAEKNKPEEIETVIRNTGPISIATKEDPYIGELNAPIEIIIFSDFKCSECAEWDKKVYPRLKADFIDKGQVKFVFKNIPFIGSDSTTGALAAEAIYHQEPDAFWTFVHLMFKNQKEAKKQWITHDFILNLAKENIKDLNYKTLSKDIKKQKYFDDVDSDLQSGITAGVNNAPALFINGTKVSKPFDYEQIRTTIKNELKK